MDTDLILRVYVGADDAAPDVMGLWQSTPGEAGVTVWEIDAGVGSTQLQVWLQDAATVVASAERFVSSADARLARFLSHGGEQAIAFATSGAGIGQAEKRLAILLEPEVQAFGLGTLREDLANAAQEASAFASQVQRMIGHPVVVHSRVGGRTLGVTDMSWTGDARTTWRSGLKADDVNLHRRAVQLALGTFRSWLRVAFLTAACAAKLALLAPAGIGALAALRSVAFCNGHSGGVPAIARLERLIYSYFRFLWRISWQLILKVRYARQH